MSYSKRLNGYNYGYQLDYALIAKIREYIQAKLQDSRYYAILAERTSYLTARELLLDLSREEQSCADRFADTYQMLAGSPCPVSPAEEPAIPDDYREALKERVRAESNDFKVYGEQYLKSTVPHLKDLFYMTAMTDNQQAMRVLMLLIEEKDG